MSNNLSALNKMLVPRDYHDTSMTLAHDLQVMLRDHPEAFDCLIFPAQESSQNEQTTLDGPIVGDLMRDEQAQSYGEPIQARAYIIPPADLEFEVVDSALYESLVGHPQAVNILLSVRGIRTFSIIQWLEYLTPDKCDTVERTYYIAETKPLGRTLNADVIHVCFPLPALGEVPEVEEEADEEEAEDEAAAPDNTGGVEIGEL